MYVEEVWLDSVHGKTFYYPAAGEDMEEAFSVFHGRISKFYFCDLKYPRGVVRRTVDRFKFASRFDLTPFSSTQEGNVRAELTYRCDETNRRYRWLEPSTVTCGYSRSGVGQIQINYRRGFGEIGLASLVAPELGVFMHRGDSAGESGSGVCYLANKKKRFEPLSNLFDLIASRAGDSLIVVSDGSNTAVSELRRYSCSRLNGSDIYQKLRGSTFEMYGFIWRCVGWMKPRNGPTLVWGLTKVNTELKMADVIG